MSLHQNDKGRRPWWQERECLWSEATASSVKPGAGLSAVALAFTAVSGRADSHLLMSSLLREATGWRQRWRGGKSVGSDTAKCQRERGVWVDGGEITSSDPVRLIWTQQGSEPGCSDVVRDEEICMVSFKNLNILTHTIRVNLHKLKPQTKKKMCKGSDQWVLIRWSVRVN